jgi:hypothetical protein
MRGSQGGKSPSGSLPRKHADDVSNYHTIESERFFQVFFLFDLDLDVLLLFFLSFLSFAPPTPTPPPPLLLLFGR